MGWDVFTPVENQNDSIEDNEKQGKQMDWS